MVALPSFLHTFDRSAPAGLDGRAAPARDSASVALLAERCVLAVTDASPEGGHAAWRAGLVARDAGLPVHLLLAPGDRGQASNPSAAARQLARDVRRRLGVIATAQAVAGKLPPLLAELAPRAWLLVLPCEQRHPWAACLLGTAPERVFRSLFMPTLVVRRPATGSYRRVLVAAELDGHAPVLIDAAQRLTRDPRIRVLHVLDTGLESTLRMADAAEHVLRLHRQHRTDAATEDLGFRIARAGAGDRAAPLVAFGSAADRVLAHARAHRTQLVVLGKRRGSRLERLFRISVAERLIAHGTADVLLLPDAPE